jgi:hypothetical protein
LSEEATPSTTTLKDAKHYWTTPPETYGPLDAEFRFTYDPCPATLTIPTVDALHSDWGPKDAVVHVNPPFRKKDGSPTAFARKAIEQAKEGRTIVLTLPTQSYVNLLLEAGAELRPLGRVKWLAVEDGEPMKGPSPITAFILRPKLEALEASEAKRDARLKTKIESGILDIPELQKTVWITAMASRPQIDRVIADINQAGFIIIKREALAEFMGWLEKSDALDATADAEKRTS